MLIVLPNKFLSVLKCFEQYTFVLSMFAIPVLIKLTFLLFADVRWSKMALGNAIVSTTSGTAEYTDYKMAMEVVKRV